MQGDAAPAVLRVRDQEELAHRVAPDFGLAGVQRHEHRLALTEDTDGLHRPLLAQGLQLPDHLAVLEVAVLLAAHPQHPVLGVVRCRLAHQPVVPAGDAEPAHVKHERDLLDSDVGQADQLGGLARPLRFGEHRALVVPRGLEVYSDPSSHDVVCHVFPPRAVCPRAPTTFRRRGWLAFSGTSPPTSSLLPPGAPAQ